MNERLYDRGCYPTERLERLRTGDKAPTAQDVAELFRMYQEGNREAGVKGTMVEFGAWLVGNNHREVQDWFTECEPAAVVW